MTTGDLSATGGPNLACGSVPARSLITRRIGLTHDQDRKQGSIRAGNIVNSVDSDIGDH